MEAQSAPNIATTKLPLAVDLDGTLIHCDLFTEAILRFVFTYPWRLPELLWWLVKGRAYAKMRLAEWAPGDPASLPYDARIIAWLIRERAAGRTLALATASDQKAAAAVADHVGLFDAVFASDGSTNLKSRRKAERLAAAYPGGFVYAGNERADLAAWSAAQEAVIANASPGLERRARRAFIVEQSFARETDALRSWIKALRPQQWAKNALVFLPMLVGQGWFNTGAWAQAASAFAALCCAASSVYLINDAADIDADRHHPRKRTRPFASGALSPLAGIAVALILLAAAITIAIKADVLPLLLLYLAAATFYTFWLKRVVLVDVFLLAGLYAIRVVLGGAATGYEASSWLLAFSCFFFLSLALVKRVAEIHALAGGDLNRRGYVSTDEGTLTMMGVGASFVAALVLALYMQSNVVAANYRAPDALWVLPAGLVFWSSRVWLKTSRGEMHDDPLVFALRDPVSWLIALIASVGFAFAATGPI
jgi:4-hydroxybenzoate polyprenyltransferase